MTRLALPPGDFKAYLFDCDGTIADSMPVHYRAWKQALDEWQCAFTEDRFYEWAGMPVPEVIERLAREQGLDLPVGDVAARKEELYHHLVPTIVAVPGVLAHIEAQRGRLPMAVVSGSTREAVEATLAVLALDRAFDALVCAGDYARSKPDPEPFLVAAARLGVPPAACLVFEDGQLGIDAADAAGMAWVRVPPPWER